MMSGFIRKKILFLSCLVYRMVGGEVDQNITQNKTNQFYTNEKMILIV